MIEDSPTHLLRTNAQLRAALLTRLQQPASFLIIDLTHAATTVAEICLLRADGRLRQQAVNLTAATPEAMLKEALQALPAGSKHLVLLISDALGESAAKAVLPWHSAGARSNLECLAIAVDAAGRWNFHGSTSVTPPKPPQILLHVGGVQHRWAAHHEPCQLRFHLGGQPREYSRFRLQLTGSELMLAPAWFRLNGPDIHCTPAVAVTVDYENDATIGPHWLLEVLDARTSERLDDWHCEPIEEPAAPPNLTVGVVLDRTCADNALWPKAARYVRSEQRSWLPDEMLAALESQPPVKPQSISPNDYNQALRTSLGQALLDALAEFPPPVGGAVEIMPAWHADVGDDGFHPVELPEPPEGKSFGRAPTIPLRQSEQIRQCFHLNTWIPGQDVFDPVELVVDDLLQAFQSKPPGTAAILIVGNSPPNLVNENEEAQAWKCFSKLVNSDFSTRLSSGTTWAQTLKNARRAGIPIIWAMLRHAPSEEAMGGVNEVYNSLQNCVIEAMGTFSSLGLDLTSSHVATPEGVEQALKESFALLQKRLPSAAATTLRLEHSYS